MGLLKYFKDKSKWIVTFVNDITNCKKIDSIKIYVDIILCRLRLGALPHDYFIFEFYKKNWNERLKYMTYIREIKFIRQIGDEQGVCSIGGGKRQFNAIFSDYICREWIWVPDSSAEEFCSFVKKHQSVLIKTNGTCSGDNIYKYTYITDNNAIEEYNKIKTKHTLCEEILRQHHKMSNFNPSSVNTVRIATLYQNGKVYLLSSALRIGAGDGPTDNLHGEGVAIAVDLDTGLTISKGYTNLCKQYLLHPISKLPLIGFQIPNWDMAKKCVIDAAKLAYEKIGAQFVGWDVAILENGVALIEGNPHQANDLIQLGQGGIWDKLKEILKKA